MLRLYRSVGVCGAITRGVPRAPSRHTDVCMRTLASDTGLGENGPQGFPSSGPAAHLRPRPSVRHHNRRRVATALQNYPPTEEAAKPAPSSLSTMTTTAATRAGHLRTHQTATTTTTTTTSRDDPVYAKSIHKRLPSRRHVRPTTASGSPARASDNAADADPYDPALVVHVDSSRRQVHLNSIQSELVWKARQKEYHSVLHRIVCCLQGHQSPVEKASTLMALHDVVVRQRLRLRVDTYEDILHVLYAVGVGGHVRAAVSGHASASPSPDGKLDARVEADVRGKSAMAAPLALPAEFATARAASSALLSESSLARIWTMYRYLVDSGTDPSPRVLQYVMGLLEHGALEHAGATHSSQQPLIESKAHSLLMDADRFRLTPTEYTINSYIGICDVFGVMHLAAARVTDYQTRHERQASPGMYARLLTGLVRHGHHEEAMAMVTTMNSVAMSVYLLNAVLQAGRHSRDPMCVFSLYRAVLGGRHRRRRQSSASSQDRLVPTIHTFSILIEVLTEQGHTGDELTFVLDEMQHYRVKGNVLLLNKLLRTLLEAGRRDEAAALRAAMMARHVQVFDELAAQLQAD